MDNETIRQGETFEVTITDTDLTADTVTLTISNEDITVSESAGYSTIDDKRVATITLNSPSLIVGEYKYMYTIEYTTGFIQKLPDIEQNCDDGSCELPKFIVCEANDIIESS